MRKGIVLKEAKTESEIERAVRTGLESYFSVLGEAAPLPLYGMILSAVEPPLLRFALGRCGGNQTAAAKLLGLDRNTLRKKLLAHGMVEGVGEES